jgi:uncharacterized protein (TIGR03083 family)
MTSSGPDYLSHIAAESARFAQALAGTPGEAQVPTCPGWTVDDLLWHLGEVQWFWGTIVRDRVDGAAAEQLKPPRPVSRAGLTAFYRSASRELLAALTSTPPGTQVWTWAEDQSASFVRRRQAHEALIHRIDAELTAGDRTAMDPALSADGVDEALRIMHGGDIPAWGTFAPADDGTLEISAADTGDSWVVALGQIIGTDPDTGQAYDQPGIRVAAGPAAAAAARVTGTAADLDCWLWHRPTLASLSWSGASSLRANFVAFTAPGIN